MTVSTVTLANRKVPGSWGQASLEHPLSGGYLHLSLSGHTCTSMGYGWPHTHGGTCPVDLRCCGMINIRCHCRMPWCTAVGIWHLELAVQVPGIHRCQVRCRLGETRGYTVRRGGSFY